KELLCIYTLIKKKKTLKEKLKFGDLNFSSATTKNNIYNRDDDEYIINNSISVQSDTLSYIQTEEINEWFDLSAVPQEIEEIVEVKPSTIPNAGNGLFAKIDIPNAMPLGFFFGVPMLEEEFELHKDNIGVAADYSIRYKHTILDATDKAGMPYTDP